MDLGTITSVAQTLFAALQCPELREICSRLHYKSELKKLEETVKTVKAVLLDAEARDGEEFTHQAQLFIEQLKEVVYDADDLLDEFVTIAERTHKKVLKDGAMPIVLDYLHRLFSPDKDFRFAYKMSGKVKEIRKKLDDIANNHGNFGFRIDSPPIRKRRDDICSDVYTTDIIGRDGDKEKIVGVLLDPNVKQNVSFLTIVGIGGLGKTALAWLIYNDERIQNEFPTRLWVCVGDDDPNHLNVNIVLDKILGSTSSNHKIGDSRPDVLQAKVKECLAKKKYLLFLDDMLNENRDDWRKLETLLLKESPTGSRVLVTTRSRDTAKIIGDGSVHVLKGLSDEDSWLLFEKVAFGQEGAQTNRSELVEIGQRIVRKCANVPLAIKVVGNLLYGQDRDNWSLFEMNTLLEVSPRRNNILPILKFSYYHLDSPLKSCFSYCALFPKDYMIKKEMLISLWMAQGFVVPLEIGQSIEDAGEKYFSILLRRCFFQDVRKDEYGEIISVKLHDVAQEVTKNEVRAIDCIKDDLGEKVRHVSVVNNTEIAGSLKKSKVRSLLYMCGKNKGLSVGNLLDNWMSLRALDLSCSKIVSLPDKMSKLLHLRYLDLSWNKMEVLPESFTELHNLETLILYKCECLKELPNDFCKLLKLRCLDVEGCNMITDMPTGMGKLNCLCKLTMFAVDLSKSTYGDVLEGLMILTKIKGHLDIRMKGCRSAVYEKGNNSEGGYIRNMQHLNWIRFSFEGNWGRGDHQEALMEDLQPHGNLRRLSLEDYKGMKLPSWAREDKLTTLLPKVQQIGFIRCGGLKHLPSFGKLHHLRNLKLSNLKNLEYMEENRESSNTGAGAGEKEGCLCFPSLKVLELRHLERLKGWWREEQELEDNHDDEKDDKDSSSSNNSRRRQRQVSPLFPHLSMLVIVGCPELSSIFNVPNVEEVELSEVNEEVGLPFRGSHMEEKGGCSSSSNYVRGSENSSKLRKVTTDNVRWLESVLSMEAMQCLTEFSVNSDHKVKSLEEVGKVCSSSLLILSIYWCNNLKNVGKLGLQHLTALEDLSISMSTDLTLNQEAEGQDVSADNPSVSICPPVPPGLRSLRLCDLSKMVILPEWMQHLTSLQSLTIYECKRLLSLPEWMPHLTSLTQLHILGCSMELVSRCRHNPRGQDWPKIQHIPHLKIQTWI